jgi:hypothetical protein
VKYTEPLPISQGEVTSALASRAADVIVDALIRMSLSELDWEWAERICLIALKNDGIKVKAAALRAIGNVARRFHVLHLDVVLPAIYELREDSNCKGIVDDVLDDIAIFIRSGNSPA